MYKTVATVALGLVCATHPAQAENRLDSMVQAPSIGAPEQGSVAGTLANVSFGPGDLSRGNYGLPAPLSVPTDRAMLLAGIFPSYAPDSGQSEWGMGWQTNLSITRHRVVGELDYESDEFTSPWGRLRAGDDGYWYPLGMQGSVRLRFENGDWEAILPDGTRQFYTERVDGVRGTYAWYLSSVETIFEDVTRLQYERNESGRPFVTEVTYGDAVRADTYRVELQYEQLGDTVTSYRSGRAIALDRRVAGVSVSARRDGSGGYQLRWSYALGYRDSALGPAYYLSSVTRTFASGAVEPPVSYQYDIPESELEGDPAWETDALTEVPGLEPLFAATEDVDALQPHRATLYDADRDGLIDLEYAPAPAAFTTFSQEEPGVWREQPAVVAAVDADPRCLPRPSAYAPPRQLVRLIPGSDEPQVIAMDTFWSSTELLVCDLRGRLLHSQQLEGPWEFGPNTRLVDLNKDHRPDLVRIGYGDVEVLENISGDGCAPGTVDCVDFGFQERSVGYLEFVQGTWEPDTTWFHDINGDGNADLVGRSGSALSVWYGLGNFEFAPESWLPVTNLQGRELWNLDRFELTWVDANRDGLSDLVLSIWSESYLFINTGSGLSEVRVAAFEDAWYMGWQLSSPVVADVRGSGNTELAYTVGRQAYAMSLDTASTGLLTQVDDHRGTVVGFEYDRAPAYRNIGSRGTVLAAMTMDVAGRKPVTVHYDYEEPVMHTLGRFLVGYKQVVRIAPMLAERVSFLHDDEIAGVVRKSLTTDKRTPAYYKISKNDYERRAFAGVPWMRQTTARSGIRGYDGAHELSTKVTYSNFYNELCAQTATTTGPNGTLVSKTSPSRIAALGEALYCSYDSETMVGTHPDASRDFHYRSSLERNGYGQIVSSRAWAGSESLLQQTVTYDSYHRVSSVTSPSGGTATAHYDPQSGLLREIQAPDGTSVRVDERDPVTDALRAITADRGAGSAPNTTHYRFDGYGRLAKYWDSLTGASEANPLAEYGYEFSTRVRPGRVTASVLVDATQASRLDSIALVRGDGSTLAAGTRIPEGWAVGGLETTDPVQLESRGYVRDPVASLPESLDYDDLYAGATELTMGRSSGFGASLLSWAVVQTGVEHEVTSRSYFDDNTLVSEQVENGRYRTRSATDASGAVLWVEDQDGHKTHFAYDASGRLIEVALADGARTRATFDGFGRPATAERDNFGHTAFLYAPVTGLLAGTEVYGPDGTLERTAELAYDDIGRITSVTHTLAATGEQRVFETFYDGAPGFSHEGQLGLVTGQRGDGYERMFVYDALGRVSDQTVTIADWRTIAYHNEYLSNGQLRAVTRVVSDSQSGEQLDQEAQSFHYDDYGRLHRLLLNGETLGTVRYDSLGRLAGADLRDGTSVDFTFDETTRATNGFFQQGAGWTSGTGWTLNARGLVSVETMYFDDEAYDRSYSYDARGYLTGSSDKQGVASYAYDKVGMPTDITDSEGTRYVDRGASRSLWIDDIEYRYDELGRLVGKGELELSYGPDGQLSTASRGDDSWRYVYDESGQRLAKLSAGRPVVAYVDGSYLTEDRIVTPVKVGGKLIGVIENGEFHILATDQRGTTIANLDGSAAVASPYGVRAERPDLSEAFDFIEKGYDSDLGTVRMGVRDYDPLLSQFTTPDPQFLTDLEACAKSPVECNLYGYARNNPISFMDPSGFGGEEMETPIYVWRRLPGVSCEIEGSGEYVPIRVGSHGPARSVRWPRYEQVIDGAGDTIMGSTPPADPKAREIVDDVGNTIIGRAARRGNTIADQRDWWAIIAVDRANTIQQLSGLSDSPYGAARGVYGAAATLSDLAGLFGVGNPVAAVVFSPILATAIFLDDLGSMHRDIKVTNKTRHLATAYGRGLAFGFDGTGSALVHNGFQGWSRAEVASFYRGAQVTGQIMNRWERRALSDQTGSYFGLDRSQVTGKQVERMSGDTWERERGQN